MSNAELKPCPFCGGEAWLYSYEFHRGTGGYSVLCKNKNCHLVFGEHEKDGYLEGEFYTKAEAIEAWNTRHERTCKFMPYSEKSDDGICSKCGAYMYEQDNYCPDCGARVTN